MPKSLKCPNEMKLINYELKKRVVEFDYKVVRMLLWDSYEAHKSDKVFEFLKKHPHVHLGVIPGEITSLDQPLDINFNKQFKTMQIRKHLQIP